MKIHEWIIILIFIVLASVITKEFVKENGIIDKVIGAHVDGKTVCYDNSNPRALNKFVCSDDGGKTWYEKN